MNLKTVVEDVEGNVAEVPFEELEFVAELGRGGQARGNGIPMLYMRMGFAVSKLEGWVFSTGFPTEVITLLRK